MYVQKIQLPIGRRKLYFTRNIRIHSTLVLLLLSAICIHPLFPKKSVCMWLLYNEWHQLHVNSPISTNRGQYFPYAQWSTEGSVGKKMILECYLPFLNQCPKNLWLQPIKGTYIWLGWSFSWKIYQTSLDFCLLMWFLASEWV